MASRSPAPLTREHAASPRGARNGVDLQCGAAPNVTPVTGTGREARSDREPPDAPPVLDVIVMRSTRALQPAANRGGCGSIVPTGLLGLRGPGPACTGRSARGDAGASRSRPPHAPPAAHPRRGRRRPAIVALVGLVGGGPRVIRPPVPAMGTTPGPGGTAPGSVPAARLRIRPVCTSTRPPGIPRVAWTIPASRHRRR
ncbi:hypothetical protein Krad_2688 [Kineococcus radiotolerans SRS30216 = ATCC BAA-149]|uniref:Uncharacterized protein n=1 Tax=Kineococcus radiotolerans (strain ATCC BAA-149 / DSM 14245 / SRS30216) TaxID=266940 RepID=A6WBH1_KINRD|nr:hypothetical protein Krad_2688 [Kineococcus radiotolerans SRS30216 = ATCC BAA-149]